MGNRAVVAFESALSNGEETSIYLHWNGGRDSVEGFLMVAKELRIPATPAGLTALAETLGPAFFNNTEESPTGLTIYLQPYSVADTDNYDNGTYILKNGEWEISQRLFNEGSEQSSFDPVELATYVLHKIAGYSDEDAEARSKELMNEIQLPENIEEIRAKFASVTPVSTSEGSIEVVIQLATGTFSAMFETLSAAKGYAIEAMKIEGFEQMTLNVG